MTKDTILTGIRSNDEPTLGNYIGAMRPMADLQKKYGATHTINMFVPDLHSFTTPVNHANLYANALRGVSYFIAAGVDIQHEHTFIYRQSYIPAHSELTWILSCFTHYSEMTRMTQFKDKSAGQQHSVSMGLLNYPVLMAADILLYNAKWIPVGDDQTQHLEITRDIALRMNHLFHDLYPLGLFTVPEDTRAQIAFSQRMGGGRIRSLADPTKKMSKSIKDPKGTILLNDDPAIAAKKVMSATTDSFANIQYDWQRQPGITNLLEILAHLSGEPLESTVASWQGNERYGDLKKAVASSVEAFLSTFQAAYRAIDAQSVIVQLEKNEIKMRDRANTTLLKVQKAVGLRP